VASPTTYHLPIAEAEALVHPAQLRDVLASLRKAGIVRWWTIKVNVVVIQCDRDLGVLADIISYE
jgi:hypothetical protein